MVLFSPILSCAHRACCARVVRPLALISGHDPFPSSPGCLLRLVLYPSFFFGLFLRHQYFSLEKILQIKEFTTPQGTPFFFFCDFENVLVVVGEIVSKRNGRFSTFCDIMLVSCYTNSVGVVGVAYPVTCAAANFLSCVLFKSLCCTGTWFSFIGAPQEFPSFYLRCSQDYKPNMHPEGRRGTLYI